MSISVRTSGKLARGRQRQTTLLRFEPLEARVLLSLTHVTNVTSNPWNWVVDIERRDGSTIWETSGALISEYHVLTCGHAVHPGGGGVSNFYDSGDFEIYIGRNGDDRDFNGTGRYGAPCKATQLWALNDWIDNDDFRSDMAVIKLDRPIGDVVGHFGRLVLSESQLENSNLNLSGYPAAGSYTGDEQYHAFGPVNEAYDYTFDYLFSEGLGPTYGGHSGSPVWRYLNDQNQIVGVHRGGDGTSGQAVRLTSGRFSSITDYMNSGTAPTSRPALMDYDDWFDVHTSSVNDTSVSPGDDFSVSAHVFNGGTLNASSCKVNFYASTNTTISTSDELIGTDYISVSPASWSQASWSGSFPSSVPSGSYYVGWIIDPDNTISEYADGSDDGIWSTSTTVTVTNVPDDTNDQISEASSTSVGSTVTGYGIDPGEDVDMFAFSVSAGQSVGFDIDLPSAGLDSYIRLFNSSGTELDHDDDGDDGPAPGESSSRESYLEYTFTSAGTYYLGVSGYNNNAYNPLTGTGDVAGSTGDYELTIANIVPDDTNDQISEASSTSVGSTVTGYEIDPGEDVDMFAFSVSAGQRVGFDIDLPSAGLDSYIRLFDSSGTELDYDDDGDDGPAPGESSSRESYLEYTFTSGGTYYLGVSGYNNNAYNPLTGTGDVAGSTGDYELTITDQEPPVNGEDKIGVHRPVGNAGYFIQDPNGNGYWDAGDCFFEFGYGTDTPIVGDWNGDGYDEIGVHRAVGNAGYFIQDYNGNGYWDGGDRYFEFGYGSDTPIIGDWNGDGYDEIGVHRPVGNAGYFIQDYNGNGYWDGGDRFFEFGYGTDTPIIGDWNGTVGDEIGVHRGVGNAGYFIQDYNGNGYWDGSDQYHVFGYASDVPIIGDWNGDGTDQIGVHREVGNAGYFIEEYNGNGYWDGGDRFFEFGYYDDIPIIGNWASASPLMAAEGEIVPDGNLATLKTSDLAPIVEEAFASFEAIGLDAKRHDVEYVITDLPGAMLGLAEHSTIYLDYNAAGHGWFVDLTPAVDEEFERIGSGESLYALDPVASDALDLLTVVSHELGHVLGLQDLSPEADSLMSSTLEKGLRRRPGDAERDAVLAGYTDDRNSM